jgi:hypothetical protein
MGRPRKRRPGSAIRGLSRISLSLHAGYGLRLPEVAIEYPLNLPLAFDAGRA